MIIPTHIVFENNSVTIKNGLVDIKEVTNKNFLYECSFKEAQNFNSYNELKQEPYLFIFHKSRCGSTLLCNIFKQFDENLVLCEPESLNQVINSKISDENKKILLKRIINLMCNEAYKYNKRLVIKFTSYHVQYVDLYKSLYDETKTLYSTRDTMEVIRSNLEKPDSMTRYNKLNTIPKFNMSINSHYLYHIYEMDDFGKKCHYVIDYQDLIRLDFIDYFKNLLNITIDDETIKKIDEIKGKYSKGYTKFYNVSKNTLGIELYNNSLNKENCKFIRDSIDKYATYVKINIKKCLTFSIFEHGYWDIQKRDMNLQVDVQNDFNKAFSKTFDILRNVVYDKLEDYCTKYNFFYKSLCLSKTGNIKQDLLNNTDITTFNLTKYDPEIHDCSLYHSEDTFINLEQATRKVAILFYLNDIENSGETEFYFQDIKIQPKEGSLALFSPTWFNTHRGNVSHTKTKYIITSWVHTKLHHNNKLYKHYEIEFKENKDNLLETK